MSTQAALAHNTWRTAEVVPVIIEDPEFYPFEPGERANDWHEASEEEYQAYEDYWEAHDE